jgi:hypothetical protein
MRRRLLGGGNQKQSAAKGAATAKKANPPPSQSSSGPSPPHSHPHVLPSADGGGHLAGGSRKSFTVAADEAALGDYSAFLAENKYATIGGAGRTTKWPLMRGGGGSEKALNDGGSNPAGHRPPPPPPPPRGAGGGGGGGRPRSMGAAQMGVKYYGEPEEETAFISGGGINIAAAPIGCPRRAFGGCCECFVWAFCSPSSQCFPPSSSSMLFVLLLHGHSLVPFVPLLFRLSACFPYHFVLPSFPPFASSPHILGIC